MSSGNRFSELGLAFFHTFMSMLWVSISVFIFLQFAYFYIMIHMQNPLLYGFDLQNPTNPVEQIQANPVEEIQTNPVEQKEQYFYFHNRKEIFAKEWEDVEEFFKLHPVRELTIIKQYMFVDLFFNGEWSETEKNDLSVLIENEGFWKQRSQDILSKELERYGCSLQNEIVEDKKDTITYYYKIEVILSKINGKVEMEIRGGYTLIVEEDQSQAQMIFLFPYFVGHLGLDWFFTHPGT